jgi:hypothetical protein
MLHTEFNLKPFLIHKPYWLADSLFAVCDRTSDVQTHAGSRVDIAQDAVAANTRTSWKWNRRLLCADHGLRDCA